MSKRSRQKRPTYHEPCTSLHHTVAPDFEFLGLTDYVVHKFPRFDEEMYQVVGIIRDATVDPGDQLVKCKRVIRAFGKLSQTGSVYVFKRRELTKCGSVDVSYSEGRDTFKCRICSYKKMPIHAEPCVSCSVVTGTKPVRGSGTYPYAPT